MRKVHWIGVLGLCLLALAFIGGMAGRRGGQNSIPGTFLLTVTPQQGPAFSELLVFHGDGTISETNTTLHANSASGPLGVNGSAGFGAWTSSRRHGVTFRFVKLIFDGTTDVHTGYLVVEGSAIIRNDRFAGEDALVMMLVGTDFDNPDQVIPLGLTDAEGRRISAE